MLDGWRGVGNGWYRGCAEGAQGVYAGGMGRKRQVWVVYGRSMKEAWGCRGCMGAL